MSSGLSETCQLQGSLVGARVNNKRLNILSEPSRHAHRVSCPEALTLLLPDQLCQALTPTDTALWHTRMILSSHKHAAASLQRTQGHCLCAARTVLPVLTRRATAAPTRLPQHLKPAIAPQLVTAPCTSAEQHAVPRNISTAAAAPDADAAGEPAQPEHLFAKKVAGTLL